MDRPSTQLMTDRLLIRRFRAADGEAMHAYLGDPEVVHFEPYDPLTPDECRHEAARRATDPGFWAVCLLGGAGEAVLVGSLWLHPVPLPGEQLRQSLLLYSNTALTPQLDLRTRLQASRLRDDPARPWRRGYVLSQDVGYQINRALKLTARYALFDADDYDTRQYVFEQDVLLAVSVPALYGQGTRIYGLAEIRLNRALTLWLRYAETRYRYQNVVGSGLEAIQGSLRGEVKAQLRVKF